MLGKKKTQSFLCCLVMLSFYCGNSFALDPVATAAGSFADCSNAAEFLNSVETAKKAFDVASEVGSEAAMNSAKEAWTVLKTKHPLFFAALSDLNVLNQIHSIAVDAKDAACGTYSSLCPNKKGAATSLKVDEMYEILMAKKLLEECLMKHARGKRGPSGRPKECEETARMFAMIAGIKALDKKTKIYNQMRDTYERKDMRC